MVEGQQRFRTDESSSTERSQPRFLLLDGIGSTVERMASKPLTPDELLAHYEGLPDDVRRAVSDLVRDGAALAPPKALTHRAIGRLVFQVDGTDGSMKPLHHMPVQLWDHDLTSADDFLGQGETDADGRFEIRYDPAQAGTGSLDLHLRIFEPQHTFDRSGTPRDTLTLVRTVDLHPTIRHSRVPETVDFGTCRVPHWEYDPSRPIPRLWIPEHGTPPTSYAPGRTLVMVEAVAPLDLIKAKHLLEHRLAPHRPTLEQIQNDFPENLTRRLEREHPGQTRGDAFFGLRLMNGMSASVFDRDPANPERFWLHHHWNSYEHDGVHALPNVDMFFELRDEQLHPVEITLHLRQPGATAPNSPTESHTFNPADGERWQQAKRVARVSAALLAELDMHLVQTHLNVEQYAIAAQRNLRRNPIRTLLAPHLKEVVLINHSADSLLLGPTGYITRASALTADALDTRIGQVLGTLDWRGFEPQEPIAPKHTYARAAQLFWGVLRDLVDVFFDHHGDAIREHWLEVHRFSQDLVDHSVPSFLCGFLKKHLAPQSTHSAPGTEWFQRHERMDVDPERHRPEAPTPAVSPITHSDSADPKGLENLKQVCRYVIFHATFRHTWSNSQQYDDGGEILYNGLGLRFGDHGVLAPESDLSIAPPPDRASELLWISAMLSKAAYGFILANEEHDIYPAFLEILRRRTGEFKELGVDVRKISSRVNI